MTLILFLTMLQVKTPDVSGGSVLYPSQMVPQGPGKEPGTRRKRKQSASEVCFVRVCVVSPVFLCCCKFEPCIRLVFFVVFFILGVPVGFI